MPLTREQLEALRADAFADDVEIEDSMTEWTAAADVLRQLGDELTPFSGLTVDSLGMLGVSGRSETTA